VAYSVYATAMDIPEAYKHVCHRYNIAMAYIVYATVTNRYSTRAHLPAESARFYLHFHPYILKYFFRRIPSKIIFLLLHAWPGPSSSSFRVGDAGRRPSASFPPVTPSAAADPLAGASRARRHQPCSSRLRRLCSSHYRRPWSTRRRQPPEIGPPPDSRSRAAASLPRSDRRWPSSWRLRARRRRPWNSCCCRPWSSHRRWPLSSCCRPTMRVRLCEPLTDAPSLEY
jgi:hypothetical protein